MPKTMPKTAKTAIVVGGGHGGLQAATMLSKKGIAVTVVSPLAYWDYSISSPRCVVEAEEADVLQYTPPLDGICKHIKATFVQGKVTDVSDSFTGGAVTGVTLEGGAVLEASVVVVAIGGSYTGGAIWKNREHETTAEARAEGFKEMAAAIAAAENVVISGAGLVGVEVAGEIKTKFPSKCVTLVGKQSGTAKIIQKTTAALEKLGVDLKEGRTVGEPADGVVNMKEGGALKCDLLLPCAGFAFDASCLKANFEGAITTRGQVVTEPSLLVQGSENVFALGDIVAIPEGKFGLASGATQCEAMARIVTANALAVIAGKKGTKAFGWAAKADSGPCLSTFGPANGVGDIGMPGCLGGMENAAARKFKAKDFFMAKFGPPLGMGKTW